MQRIRVAMTKWDGQPHWEHDAVLLGEDDHGAWLGMPAGTPHTRPGATYVQESDAVSLVTDDWCLPTIYAPGAPVAVYVDVATPPDLADGGLASIDLDLDVVRGWSGRTWVDDEDEFARHRVAQGYPPRVVDAALEACARVHVAVRDRRPPYDGSAQVWLDRLAR